MDDIKKISKKNECDDIGKKWVRKYLVKTINNKKIWYRFCPKCGKEQTYTQISSVITATKKNSVCYSCKNSGHKNPFYGKHHTKSHREKMSSIQKSICSYRYKQQGKNPEKVSLVCRLCGNKYYVIHSRKFSKYCSYKCAWLDGYGWSDKGKTSPEIKLENILNKLNIQYVYGYPLKNKIYDFYIPDKNLLIEVDGIYWHGKDIPFSQLTPMHKKIYLNDIEKNKIAKKFGYILKRIWENDVEENYVSKYIL